MNTLQKHYETLIIGAGAAGMHCAAQAAATGKSTLVIDHAKSPGEKIRISGGGRCNFTNINTGPENFISQNRHFAKSALRRYTQHDFLDLIEAHKIAWHEKTLGQLFCNESAKQVIQMLLDEMERVGAQLSLQTSVTSIGARNAGFDVELEIEGKRHGIVVENLVVACGGKSIPKMGASGFGYQIGEQFGHSIVETRPALVPLTFGEDILAHLRPLAGIACDASVSCGKTRFDEALLFTHRGLSGPSILQISSYWREQEKIEIDLLHGSSIFEELRQQRGQNGKQAVRTALARYLPKALAGMLIERLDLTGNLADLSDRQLETISGQVHRWQVQPVGTEGYRTAEVTLGGIDTNELNSRTMESKLVKGLYFIGEVVDVTGWLGGYNFQWAWSSAAAAGTAIIEANP